MVSIRMSNIFWILLILISACSSENSTQDPQTIIDQAIEAHGGEIYNRVRIEFDFRDIHYTAQRFDGLFQYERMFPDSTRIIRDVLTNSGFTRYIDGEVAVLADTMAAKYARSVNSVWYFALLPNGLNDPPVIKTYLGKESLEGKEYDKIQVTFQQKGGGRDYDDEFIYWINAEDHRMDYMAYSYHTDGGGTRFRSVLKRQTVGGLLFQDYINFKGSGKFGPIFELGIKYEESQLEELSKIELRNIRVEVLEESFDNQELSVR